MHSKLCRTHGKKQCPHYKKCTSFTRKVNMVNSPLYKFQSMVNRINRETKLKIENAQERTHEDLAIIDYLDNKHLYSLEQVEEIKSSSIIPESKTHMVNQRKISRENSLLKGKRTRFMIKKAFELFTEEKDVKDWLIKQGIEYETEAEKDIKARIKRRQLRGILLNGGKAKRTYRKRTPKELERYENAETVSFSLKGVNADFESYIVEVDKKDEVEI